MGGSVLVRDLPLGMRRRLAFACAFVHRPELLVLDEPTSGVGPLARAGLWDGIHQAAERGSGVVLTTHSMNEAEQCDRIVVMAAGQVVASGTVEEIVGNNEIVEVRSEAWADVFSVLDDAGLPVALRARTVQVIGEGVEEVRRTLAKRGLEAEVSIVPATLEEAFVS